MMRSGSLRILAKVKLRSKSLKDSSMLYTSILLPATSRQRIMKLLRQLAMKPSKSIHIQLKLCTVELVRKLYLLTLGWRTLDRL